MKRLILTIAPMAACSLLLVGGLVAVNVILRNFTEVMIPDWYDGSRLLLGIATLWGVAITTFRGAHISVDLLWEYCGAANKRRIDIAAGVFVLLFFALLAWMTWQKVFDSGSQVTADLRLPLAYFYAAAALGGTAAVVLATLRVVNLIGGEASADALETKNGS